MSRSYLRPPSRKLISVYDFLHKPQLAYLSRESQSYCGAREIMSYIGNVPYPVDGDVAAAIEGLVKYYVMPWPEIDFRIGDWVYAKLPKTRPLTCRFPPRFGRVGPFRGIFGA